MVLEKLKCSMQYMLPQHFLSRSIAKLANCNIPFIKNILIRLFITCYKVDINTAALTQLSDYPTFNHFFTRELAKNTRVISSQANSIASPADGTVSQAGQIKMGKLFQAKGHTFSLSTLLGEETEQTKAYEGGSFITIYLAPHDYHRVHMPLDGTLIRTVYIPGKLFSVNRVSVKHVPQLFCRNERLVCYFQTEIGIVSVILVGAMLVAGIETVWGQKEVPCTEKKKIMKDYRQNNIFIPKGAEMGRFQFGSTVIVLFPPATVKLNEVVGETIFMGSEMGQVLKGNT